MDKPAPVQGTHRMVPAVRLPVAGHHPAAMRQTGQFGECRFRTIATPVAPVTRCPPPQGLASRAHAQPRSTRTGAPGIEEDRSCVPVTMHLRVDRDDDPQDGDGDRGSSGGGAGGRGGGGFDGRQSGREGDGQQGSEERPRDSAPGVQQSDAVAERRAAHDSKGVQAQAKGLALIEALQRAAQGTDPTRATLRAMGLELRDGHAREAIATLSAVKRLLVQGTRATSAMPPLDSSQARHAALLPLRLLICAAPRTPAGRQLAEERLQLAASLCSPTRPKTRR